MSMLPSLKTDNPRHRFRFAREALSAVMVITAAALLGGCSVPYYWQAVTGQVSLLNRRVPIEAAIEDPQTDAQTREALRTVLEVRRFAVDELGLPQNRSYSTYVDLSGGNAGSESGEAGSAGGNAGSGAGRRRANNSLVWSVVAAEEFSIDPRTWCFPFAGCVSYRGYFNEDAARRYAARLQGEGMDVAVGGATAYSTLGYFADPVVSTMIGGPEFRTVELILHELAHQKFYLRGDSDLNEAFATVVAEYGTERWLMRRGETGSLTAYRQQALVQAQFADLIGRQRERLREIYAGSEPAVEKRRAKEAAFETLRSEYAALKPAWEGRVNYDGWIARPLNNAHIASVATYRYWVPGLHWLLESRGLGAFYEEVETLAALDEDERRLRLLDWRNRALEAVDPARPE
ncbi:MAG: aminopeptidase [Rhodospirillaceae bacterium]|nr:aminopeptidase [Rhodospirillaceae bacterium]MDD9998530.1 aminopeptidase [Rhodospirillaceae bacterium]MDE0361662.1 aminopeptidase [Rhodospirillaceae bacterium]